MQIGDLVTRKSYQHDITFVIKDIQTPVAILQGVDYRLIADAPFDDLVYKGTRAKEPLPIPPPHPPNNLVLSPQYRYGSILHIDGDSFYLDRCMNLYKKFRLPAHGFSILEQLQPEKLLDLLHSYNPNILVLTGHDSLPHFKTTSKDENDYKNSKYFIDCIKIARTYCPSYDGLAIIAGGCKSFYEGLMQAGANFASSPGRIEINIMDPVHIACTLSMTPIDEIVDIYAISKKHHIPLNSMGGIQTHGQCRIAVPGF